MMHISKLRHLHATTALLVLACASGVQAQEPNLVCASPASVHTQTALALQLKRDGVPHTLSHGRGVCVNTGLAKHLEEARKKLDAFHYEFALRPRDSCEEKATLAWLKENNLPSELKPSTHIKGQSSGTLIFVPVIAPEDAPRYRAILAKARERDDRCAKPVR